MLTATTDQTFQFWYDLDISLAYPWNQDVIERAAEQDGLAAQAREELKEQKSNDQGRRSLFGSWSDHFLG